VKSEAGAMLHWWRILKNHNSHYLIKMKKYILIALGVGSLIEGSLQAQTIAAWNFSAVQAAPITTLAATTGSGTLNLIGFTSSAPSGDVLSTAGTANTSFSEYTLRVRNASGGWSLTAPEYSQGLELDASTVGYQNLNFSFDWYTTTQGIRDLQVQYNLNTANASGWTDIGGTSPTGTYIATPNDYYNAPGSPTISLNLSSITGAANDSSFGIRLVSAYDSTGHTASYASATLASGVTQAYNGTSGNWRFGNLDLTGTALTAVPEPAAYPMLAMGAAAIVGLIRRKK
jgi:hypothetical protein